MSKYKEAGTVIALALLCGQYKENAFMCNAARDLCRAGKLKVEQEEAFHQLWRAIAAYTGTNTLMTYLNSEGKLPLNFPFTTDNRVFIGQAFWGAVAVYILSHDKPSIAGIRRAGFKAVKALKLQ